MRRFYLQGMGRLLAIPMVSVVINKMIFVYPSQIPNFTFVTIKKYEYAIFINVGFIVCITFRGIIFF